jgi:hypothetical protein
MGTSSSGSGPRNNSPLLPNWDSPGGLPPVKDPTDKPNPENQDPKIPTSENPNTDNDKYENVPDEEQETSKNPEKPLLTGNWGSIKATLGKIANGSKSHSFKGIAKGYVRNVGGVKNAVRASRAGVSGGASIASFLGSVGLNGFNETLKIFGLSDCVGKSAEEVFAKISDKICPAGNTNDEAIARKALLDILGSLYEKFVENGNITLDNLQEKDLILAVVEYASYYIFHKWLYELGLAIENKQIDETEALGLEEEMKEFIFGEVRVELKGRKIMEMDFTSGEGKE